MERAFTEKITRNGIRRKDASSVRLDSLLGGVSQFPPRDELYVLFMKQLAECGTREEIEVALPPGGTPSVTLTRSGFHFVIGEGEVDDELSHARLKILEGRLVEVGPILRRDARINRNGVVEDDVSGTQTGFQIGPVREPVPREENRQLVIVGDAKKNLKQILAILVQPVLVGIEMRGVDAHGVSPINLRAKFQLHFLWIDAGRRCPIVMEIAVLVDQAGDLVFCSDRAPAVVNPLAGQGQMETKIGAGVSLREVSNLRKPRAGHHDAGGIDETRLQSFDRRCVDGMSHAYVVGVNDQDSRVAGEAQFFSERFSVALRVRIEERACKQEQEQNGNRFSIHEKTSTTFPAIPCRPPQNCAAI